MLHELLSRFPDTLAHPSPAVAIAATAAGAVLWLAGGRFSRAIVTLILVAVGPGPAVQPARRRARRGARAARGRTVPARLDRHAAGYDRVAGRTPPGARRRGHDRPVGADPRDRAQAQAGKGEGGSRGDR